MDEVTRVIEEVVRQNCIVILTLRDFNISRILDLRSSCATFSSNKKLRDFAGTSSTKSRGKLYLAMYTGRNFYFLKFYVNEEHVICFSLV